MADYSTEKGFTIQSLATDPYASEVLAATWSSGNNKNDVAYAGVGVGTQTAALAALGYTGTNQSFAEEYNGTSWVEATAAPTAIRVSSGAGIQTSAIMGSGFSTTYLTESFEYDGTNWTEAGDILTAREGAGGAGSANTAALLFGGQTSAGPVTGATESYNGSSWTTSPASLNTARTLVVGLGTQTAALVVGGSPFVAITEEFNGTAWAETGDLNTGRDKMTMQAAGITTAGLVAGGFSSAPTRVGSTEFFNGTTWTEVADLATARGEGYGGGTGTAAIVASGNSAGSPNGDTATEEFSAPSTASIAQEGQVWYNTTSTALKGFGQFVSTGAWASGGSLNSAKQYAAGFSPTTSLAVQAGGSPPVPVGTDTCETYDGTSWTEVNAINTARRSLPGVGTQTSGLIISGYAGGDVANVESWDGTCWAEETAVTTARRASPGFGASNTSALLTATDSQANTELWNGTAWTELVDPNTPRGQSAGSGIATSGMYAGGNPTPNWSKAETWDGTSWTEVADLLTGRGEDPGSAGVSGTNALIIRGRTPAPSWADVAFTEYFDGTSWTELADMAYARISAARSSMGAGSTGALAVGGITPPATAITAVEEWSLSGAIKTFTAS